MTDTTVSSNDLNKISGGCERGGGGLLLSPIAHRNRKKVCSKPCSLYQSQPIKTKRYLEVTQALANMQFKNRAAATLSSSELNNEDARQMELNFSYRRWLIAIGKFQRVHMPACKFATAATSWSST